VENGANGGGPTSETGAAGVTHLELPLSTVAVARNAALDAIDSGSLGGGAVFIGAGDRLDASMLDTCLRVLRVCPNVAVVSVWCRASGDKASFGMSPTFPFQWARNETSVISCYRVEAVRSVGGYAEIADPRFADWELVNRLLVAGWLAATIPLVLAGSPRSVPLPDSEASKLLHSRLIAPYPHLTKLDLHELVTLAGTGMRRTDTSTGIAQTMAKALHGLGKRIVNRIT